MLLAIIVYLNQEYWNRAQCQQSTLFWTLSLIIHACRPSLLQWCSASKDPADWVLHVCEGISYSTISTTVLFLLRLGLYACLDPSCNGGPSANGRTETWVEEYKLVVM
jgi:hypothetical protein